MRKEFIAIFTAFLLLTGLAFYYQWLSGGWVVIAGILFLICLYDAIQSKHAILKNFPVVGHMRYLLEMVRPEIQQYFVEADTTPDPIARIYRSVVYQNSKSQLATVPFGTQLDVYSQEYRWANHSCFPVSAHNEDFRISIGGPKCLQPYSASLLNISAMSYGSLSKNAILALGRGAKAGGFYHNTGEGGLSPHHLASGADVVWQLGTAYFGARDDKGYFSPDIFKERAVDSRVKMIEIKISQGAKPGHGGILPGVKVDAEIAKIRHVPEGKTVISPPGHTAFTNCTELCEFIQKLRDLSGGKPIGFKLCLGRREEFIQICEAIVKTGISPDYIAVDGGEGGTGAAPFDFINYVGSPLNEALIFVHHTLGRFGIREDIRLIATGKVMTGFNILEKLAMGADLCASARGMMLSLGCIQAYRCNTNKCPTGVATNNARLAAGLNVEDKGERVASFHRETITAIKDLIGAMGLHSPAEVDMTHISCRHEGKILTLAELYEKTMELSAHEEHDRQVKAQGEPSAPEAPEPADSVQS